ncbi:MAG: cell division protein FtsA, partial [Rhodospirillales bacterium]
MSRTHTSIKGLKAGDVIGAIDLGSSKVACLIARLGSDGVPRIMGFGHQVSQGVRGGVIVDLEKVERDIRQTVATAEQMAGETIRDCIVGISGGLHSRLLSFDLDIAGHEIADRDLARVERHPVLAQAITPDQALLHRLVVAYRIDGCRSVKDPRGMFGERLTVNMHLLTVADGALRTLDTAVERSHLSPVLHVAQPHAAALGALTPDEIQLGVTVIDMGAETTSLALFLDGELVHADVLGLGGGHVTRDIAQGLNTPLDHAERMKTLWGSVIKAESDNREILRVPQIGSEVSGEPEVEMPRS